MTNFETALQNFINQEISVCFRGEHAGAHTGSSASMMDLKVLEVMSDSFVGAWADRTVYVQFDAIAYFIPIEA